jgi:hypothetical protein
MSRALEILGMLDGKKTPANKPTNENGVITKKFREPTAAKPVNEVSPQEIVQAVIHALNNFNQNAPISQLKAQLIPKLMQMAPGKYDESVPMKRTRYEVPAAKVGAIAEVLKLKFKGRDIVVEEKDDAVEVLSKEDVEDIIIDVLKQLGLVDDEEDDEDEEGHGEQSKNPGISAGGVEDANADGEDLTPGGSYMEQKVIKYGPKKNVKKSQNEELSIEEIRSTGKGALSLMSALNK